MSSYMACTKRLKICAVARVGRAGRFSLFGVAQLVEL